MGKAKKQLLSSAPWRDVEEEDKFADGRLKATNQPGSTPTMYVPSKKKKNFNKKDNKDNDDDDFRSEIDPELRYSFQRNFQFLCRVFTIDTIVKPLPPAMAYNVSRNLSFFTRIFTQFFGEPDFHLPFNISGIVSLVILFLRQVEEQINMFLRTCQNVLQTQAIETAFP
ncbi:hypothetical protein Ancab_037312 [Ancistrocladus abbreviatus]